MGGQPCPGPWFIPVSVEAEERVGTMARGQLAAEVTDVQAARLLARAGDHPARGSQKREGFLRGQKLLVRSGGRRLVRHGWRWPSAGYLWSRSAPTSAPAPTLNCPPSSPRLGVPAAVHLRAERPPLPRECGAARGGRSRPQPSGPRVGSPVASAAASVAGAAAIQPGLVSAAPPPPGPPTALAAPNCCSPPSAGRD